MKRPLETDYAPYYNGYISKVQGEDILAVLEKQHAETLSVFNSLDDEKGKYRYAEDKWTIKELIGHVIDAERVFSYRAMSIARGEQQHLPGFEQEEYVKNAKFDKRTIASLTEEYSNLRLANIALFRTFTEEDLERRGKASNNPVTVRALLFISAGHEKHHLDILKERYSV